VRPAQVLAALTAWAVVGVLGWFVAEGWLDAVACNRDDNSSRMAKPTMLSVVWAIVACLGLLREAVEAPFRRG
jgi:hypothetical protein